MTNVSRQGHERRVKYFAKPSNSFAVNLILHRARDVRECDRFSLSIGPLE